MRSCNLAETISSRRGLLMMRELSDVPYPTTRQPLALREIRWPGRRNGVGLGLRWKSPVGPLRIDIARGLDDPDRLFFDRVLMMEGDTELGLLLKNSLDALGPLWPVATAQEER